MRNDKLKLINLRPFCFIAGAFIIGILLGFLYDNYLLLILPVCAAIVLLCVYFKKIIIALVAFSMALGMVCMVFAKPNITNDDTYYVHARVYSIEDNSCILSDVYLDGIYFNKFITVDIDLLDSEDLPKLDDVVKFAADVEFIKASIKDSYSLSTLSDHIGAAAYNIANYTVIKNLPSISGLFHSIRYAIGQRIDALFSDNAPLIRGILLGDTRYIDSNTLKAVRASGIAHVLALSGLHVSFISVMLNRLFKKSGFYFRNTATFIILFIYLAIVGFPPSFVRAVLLTMIVFLAKTTRRKYDQLSALAFAAVVMLAFEPYALFSVSFIMSFGAMIGIATLMPHLDRFFSAFLYSPLPGMLSVSISATAGSLPAILFYFKNASTYSLLANLVVVPLASIVVPTSIFALLLSLVSNYIALPFVFLSNLATDAIKLISNAVCALPFSVISVPSLPIIIPIAMYAFLLSWKVKAPARKWFVLTIAAFIASLWVALV